MGAVAVLIFLAATCSATDFDSCKNCHPNEYDSWKASAHFQLYGEIVSEPQACEICHEPPVDGYDAHIANTSDALPEVDLAAEVCGDCHLDYHIPLYMEWNEYAKPSFNASTMASHSEPTDITESFVLTRGNSCVSCKSTDGAIPNMQAPSISDFNIANAPESKNVSQWRIACVACHDPHAAGMWIDDNTQLCSNCHNSRGAVPDGKTAIVRYTQWDMLNSSEYINGKHPVSIGCTDCHMAKVNLEETAVTGHTFDFDAALLSDPQSANGCYKCHNGNLSALVSEKQVGVSAYLDELAVYRDNASTALEKINGTVAYEGQKINYTNALFYVSEVEEDGSLGIHNMNRSKGDLGKAKQLFNSVILAGKAAEEPKQDVQTSGFGFGTAVIMLAAVFYLVKRRH